MQVILAGYGGRRKILAVERALNDIHRSVGVSCVVSTCPSFFAAKWAMDNAVRLDLCYRENEGIDSETFAEAWQKLKLLMKLKARPSTIMLYFVHDVRKNSMTQFALNYGMKLKIID